MKSLAKILNPSTTSALPDRAALKRTSVDAKLLALKAERAATFARMVDTEKAGAGKDPKSPLDGRVRELLHGDDAPQSEPSNDGELHPLRLELQALDEAIGQLAARQEAEQLENLSAAFAQSRDVWAGINISIARNLVEAQTLYRRRAEFLATFVGARAFTGDPLAKIPLDAAFRAGAPAKTFLETAVRVGLVTKKEIEQ